MAVHEEVSLCFSVCGIPCLVRGRYGNITASFSQPTTDDEWSACVILLTPTSL